MASRPYQENEEEQKVDFNLRRGTSLKGTVRLPDGKAAAGVEVALVSDSKGAILGAAKFVDHDRSNIVPTDGDGNSYFPPTCQQVSGRSPYERIRRILDGPIKGFARPDHTAVGTYRGDVIGRP